MIFWNSCVFGFCALSCADAAPTDAEIAAVMDAVAAAETADATAADAPYRSAAETAAAVGTEEVGAVVEGAGEVWVVVEGAGEAWVVVVGAGEGEVGVGVGVLDVFEGGGVDGAGDVAPLRGVKTPRFVKSFTFSAFVFTHGGRVCARPGVIGASSGVGVDGACVGVAGACVGVCGVETDADVALTLLRLMGKEGLLGEGEATRSGIVGSVG